MRKIISLLVAGAVSVQLLAAQNTNLPITEGKFTAEDSSLEQYEYPEWFRDAKFGIWSHWGPQAVPRQGDWYARKMYVEVNYNRRTGVVNKAGKPDPHYTYHQENYGHPSEFGYKDIIPLWKAEKFDPEALMKLYKRVGAKYFVSMGVHHDNFFLWDSKIHKWNSVNMGPKRDIVGDWQKAAKKEGLKFGVSEHLGASYTWYQTAKGADTKGAKKGVPYDGANPKYEDLYHKALPKSEHNEWYTSDPECQRMWYDRMVELIDMYKPDLLYTDGKIPFENHVGRSLIADYYNRDLQRNKKSTVIYNCKEESNGRFVRDLERGIIEGINPEPWQTDTSIGNWFFKTTQGYSSSDKIIQMLVDIVSKNGNLLLNVVQSPEGDLQPEVMQILEDIAAWMEVNGEAIYSTRPWITFGEGPSLSKDQGKGHAEGIKDIRNYESGDVRFTKRGNTIYAFAMEHPAKDLVIKSMPKDVKVKKISMLGSKEKIQFSQAANGELTIKKPAKMGERSVVTFKIN
ncbi:MAG: alpha-L-fucosidase [Rikenellaceae bacterium]